MTELKRTITDAEAIDKIIDLYKASGQEEIFDNTSSTIEAIGNILETTGRQTWFEEAGYMNEEY